MVAMIGESIVTINPGPIYHEISQNIPGNEKYLSHK